MQVPVDESELNLDQARAFAQDTMSRVQNSNSLRAVKRPQITVVIRGLFIGVVTLFRADIALFGHEVNTIFVGLWQPDSFAGDYNRSEPVPGRPAWTLEPGLGPPATS